MSASQKKRTIEFYSNIKVGVIGNNRSSYYAKYWLTLTGNPPAETCEDCHILVSDGCLEENNFNKHHHAEVNIRLWDYQVGHRGTGIHASAVSGAASTIGYRDGPGVGLPNDIPEKWCGAYGAILALSEIWRREAGNYCKAIHYDVSAADVMRSFSLQNAGDSEEIFSRWRRNGRLCVEHGGIFPMGFYPCQDGYVALLGRSRRDWKNIRKAIGNPDWSSKDEFDDPFQLAKNSEKADQLLSETLLEFERDELLIRGLDCEAVIAPVYDQQEAADRNIFRDNFLRSNIPAMPFVVREFSSTSLKKSSSHNLSKASPDAPLSGLRCIELSWVWSGPMAAQILGDLGAQIIKVEAPTRFDLYRTRGLETLRGKMDEKQRIESSIYFHSLNRNKLGLSLDLKNQKQLSVLKTLTKSSDLIIENFTVGTMERLGLGWEKLSQLNSSLVQLSMSGPGRHSSVEKLRSYGLVLSALGGVESSITDSNGFLGSPTFSISDPNAAVFGAIAALTGAIRAKTCGIGSAIDLSQIEAATTLNGTPTHPRTRLEMILKTIDGYYMAISLPQCSFTDEATARETFSTLDRETLINKCGELDGETADLIELYESDKNPIFQECPIHVSVKHPYTGKESLVGAPWRLNGNRPLPWKPAPVLGESNDFILRSIIGLNKLEIAELNIEEK
ncbi:MAG: hypothetical protein CMM58_04920 [Rhodospirillaceae bacterium]|nr:hypothetical protein [Rhodospirillaceae bacterium]|tara:strand:- start:2044 stop:4065 length:2022 start_codon:yes stop_codon:yes gene_type:complete